MELNSQKYWFEQKFKRKPKNWTFEEIHDLWIRVGERSEKRRQELLRYQDLIIKEIPKNDKGERLLYFMLRDDLYSYNFRYRDDFKSYGVSTNLVRFSTDKITARSEKIDFIISNEKQFEMGKQYRYLDKMCSHKHYRVFEILWRNVEEYLQKSFKDLPYLKTDVFIISISNKKYYVKVDEQHRFSYKKFHFGGEVTDGEIVISGNPLNSIYI
jgi:hypothetical protein